MFGDGELVREVAKLQEVLRGAGKPRRLAKDQKRLLRTLTTSCTGAGDLTVRTEARTGNVIARGRHTEDLESLLPPM